MTEVFYSHTHWTVKPGKERQFLTAWLAFSEICRTLPHPPIWGTLIQNHDEPTRFHSFGPWQRAEHYQEMRNNAQAKAAFQRAMDLCSEASPGTYELVGHIGK
jgi:hypothetical protein